MPLLATAVVACVAVVSYTAGVNGATQMNAVRPVSSTRVSDLSLEATQSSRREALAKVAGLAGIAAAGPASAFEGSAIKECTNPVACGPVGYKPGQTTMSVTAAQPAAPVEEEPGIPIKYLAPLVFISSYLISLGFTAVKDYMGKDEKAKALAEASLKLRESPLYEKNIQKEIIKEGNGVDFPTAGNKVEVHYVGTLLDGTKFDSSRDRGTPFVFPIAQGRVIKGWDTVVMTMSVGEVAKVQIQPDWAYGARGSGPIPPNSVLEFEIELLNVNV